ncbi:hypothetical protein PAPYR_2407 [Paratrimastix pyriformis]|uniref:Ubiquitin carboxyl-terminal hydrolase 47 C-terminal domain-containing protein n=1 Tax=Paratrimastix pyriformis TaxID=342808 RepID=A0ABQ8UQB4_9EUKA|nr:hypothetical protein PAPYR_2407 [Paratrimastix pyriformis]
MLDFTEPYSVYVPRTATVGALRQAIADTTGVPLAEMLVLRCESYRDAEPFIDDAKELSYHLYVYEGSTLRVERLPDPLHCHSRIIAWHRLTRNYITVTFNKPASKTEKLRLRLDKNTTLQAFKAKIAPMIGRPDPASFHLLRSSYYGVSVLKDETLSLYMAGIGDNSELIVKDGAPKGTSGISINFTLYQPNVASAVPATPTPTPTPAPTPAATPAATPASEAAPAAPAPDAVSPAPSATPTPTPAPTPATPAISYHEDFVTLSKVEVNVAMTAPQVKELILEKCTHPDLDALLGPVRPVPADVMAAAKARLRLQEKKYYHGCGRVLRDTDNMRSYYIYDGCKMAVEVLPAPEHLAADDLVVREQRWDPATQALGPMGTVVLKGTSTRADMVAQLARTHGIEADQITLWQPYEFDLADVHLPGKWDSEILKSNPGAVGGYYYGQVYYYGFRPIEGDVVVWKDARLADREVKGAKVARSQRYYHAEKSLKIDYNADRKTPTPAATPRAAPRSPPRPRPPQPPQPQPQPPR